jgi:hypothetical protein
MNIACKHMKGNKNTSCLLLAPMTQDLGDSRMFVASVHNVSSYASQSPNLHEMRFLVGIRVAKSTAYKHVIWESTLNTSVEQIVAFLTMMRGGNMCCLVVLIMMMLKKPMGPFAKWASFINKTLCGIHHLKFLVEKKRIFTPKKNTRCNRLTNV